VFRQSQQKLLRTIFQLLHYFVHIEAGRFLSLRIVLERHQELSDIFLRRHELEGVIKKPVVVSVRGNVRALVRVGSEIEDFRNPQVGERLRPDAQRSRSAAP
jgi:hypothetical protein